MRRRAMQTILTLGLTLPLVLTLVFSGPLTATTGAQQGARMLGPQFPILMDSGDGVPGPGDTPLNLQYSGTTLQLPTNFSCGTQPNTTVTLGSSDGTGRFRSASRVNGNKQQVMNITGTTGGAAAQFSLTILQGSAVTDQGSGSFIDSNGDGSADTFSFAGSGGAATVSLVFTPNSSYVSIPVSQAALLGARQGRCGPAVGQIWFPMADTNGDGRGDAVVFDLDGNGSADSQFYSSPPLGAIGVPTTDTLGLVLLTLMLGGIGVWYLGRQPLGSARSI